uniref:ATP synthase F0 subunit 8 n=1 Tax=Trypanobia cryptica TaxID=2814713 RepID=A0A0K0YD72_9ANNE|nr:ATP synthase F0 subunit 8 [Trypanobia cryptica]
MPHLAPLMWVATPFMLLILSYLQIIMLSHSAPILFPKKSKINNPYLYKLNWK